MFGQVHVELIYNIHKGLVPSVSQEVVLVSRHARKHEKKVYMNK